mmetsp:Transcript_19601/g.67527  ORF Transcript_19601/g.67527 Transcript_19601/m.67527 type:complete len:236 (-) Transcript_19601:71-778(-)
MQLVFAVVLGSAAAFVAHHGPAAPAVAASTRLHAYVPSGMTKEQYAAFKAKEQAEKDKKDYAKAGARGFKSRSMQSFVAALEKGEATHLMPVDPAKVRSGEIALKDVPYMQRGGNWDNSDITGKKGWMNTGFGMKAFNDGQAEKKKENKFDAKYNALKPSTNFFGTSVGIDWTGKGEGGQVQDRAKANKISNDEQMWRDAGALSPAEIKKMASKRGGNKAPVIGEEPKKKFFGLF